MGELHVWRPRWWKGTRFISDGITLWIHRDSSHTVREADPIGAAADVAIVKGSPLPVGLQACLKMLYGTLASSLAPLDQVHVFYFLPFIGCPATVSRTFNFVADIFPDEGRPPSSRAADPPQETIFHLCWSAEALRRPRWSLRQIFIAPPKS